jgi:Type I phosphodiesterase / nucleotide pyrophosphatase
MHLILRIVRTGSQVGFDEEIDIDLTKLDAGGGINPAFLPRDPKNNCAPVYPHTFIRVNTLFEVVKAAGGYTAWSDKHQSYELVKGRSGQDVDDFYAPEINSIPVALPQVNLMMCNPLPDQTAVSSSNAWTDSFANIKCYDSLKVQAILNEIDGKSHDGSVSKPVPNVFGMNFQAVSVGQKLIEMSVSMTGGYLDGDGTPTPALLGEIQFVDAAIGKFVTELKNRGLYDKTVIIITAKHGQSPIDPKRSFAFQQITPPTSRLLWFSALTWCKLSRTMSRSSGWEPILLPIP